MKKYLLSSGLLAFVFIMISTFTSYNPAAAAGPEKWGTPGPGNNPSENSSSDSRAQRLQTNGAGFLGAGTLAAASPLSETEKAALLQAIQEEYKALNLYKSMMVTFGNVLPFNRIADSEIMHANALARTLSRYGIAVPQNPGLANPPVFTSLQDACTAGVDAETVDAALYDELISVTTHADVNRVYSNLQDASLNNHLPAFQACQ